MPDIRANGDTNNRVRFKIRKADTGQGLTGLTFSSSGLIISTIADNEATPVAYTQAGSTIETITTLGTFATPTATKCRFKEIDATNHPGLYEFQFANARFAVSNSKRLIISVSGVTNLLESDYEIEFSPPVSLASAERDAIADAHLDRADGIEAGLTPRQAHRLEAAAAAGKVSGAGTASPIVFRNAVADSKDRITATGDASGNRSAVTVDLS